VFLYALYAFIVNFTPSPWIGPFFAIIGYKSLPGVYLFMYPNSSPFKLYIMKFKILFVAICAMSFLACTKSGVDPNTGNANVVAASAVPAATIATFNANFSGATEVEWQRHSSSSFSVQFNTGGQRHDAGFDDNGHQSNHSVISLDAAVPQVVLNAFRTRFPTDNVYEWNLRTDGTWKAHFMRGTVKYEATYSADGVFIKFEQA
jgi:hypothetical protein